MGEEFDVISERMAKALEKIIPKQLEKSQADIRASLQAQETEKLRGQSSAALTKLSTEFFGESEELPDNVSSEMSKYMDRNAPNPTMTVKEYVEDAFYHAVGKLGLQKTDLSKEKKISKNRSDASAHLASARAPSDENIRKDGSKPLTRQQAIQAAIEAASKE
jgi:hypothetical protein